MTANRSRRVFLLALLLASVSALVAYWLLASRPPVAPVAVEAAAPSGEPVLTAAQAIFAGQTLTASDLEITYVPTTAKGLRALTDSTQAIGEVALVDIPKGEQILAGSIGQAPAAAALTFAKDVPVGMRAVTIASEETIGVAGFVQPGDRVDVVAAMELKPIRPAETIDDALSGDKQDGDPFPMAELILQDVEVLAIGQALDPSAPAAPPPAKNDKTQPAADSAGPAARPEATSVTLLVNPSQALRLMLAVQADATFRLLLRTPGDASVTELPPALITNMTEMRPFSLVGANLATDDLVITDVRFRETSVPAGGTLEFEATVRNVSSRLIPAGRGGPTTSYVYPQGETWLSIDNAPPDGVYSLGVTSEGAAQTYPWRWDLGKDLAPGETTTISGGIQVPNLPGVQRWWFGTLLQPGTVLQDGVAPVDITVEPVTSVVIMANEIALRETPWPNAASVLTLPRGTHADVLAYQDGWFLLRSGGKDGWVSEAFVINAVLPAAASVTPEETARGESSS